MGFLPIPANLYFQDFADNVLEYKVMDGDTFVATYRGMSDSDEDGDYIGFLVSDHPSISVGNTLCAVDEPEMFHVREILYDRYNGQPELLKAYF